MTLTTKVIKDSIFNNTRLTTMEVTLPKTLVAEFNTHRVFSRNSASSRAIPIKKVMKQVQENPWIPEFGVNGKGMSPKGVVEDPEISKQAWLAALEAALGSVDALSATGVHKQVCNRILEPWMLTKIICTSTTYENFFELRCSPDAQSGICLAANAMKEALNSSTPEKTQVHVPFSSGEFTREGLYSAVAKCARVSYLNHGKDSTPEADKRLFDMLASNGHFSPFEHIAFGGYSVYGPNNRNFMETWEQFRAYVEDGCIEEFVEMCEKCQ